VIGIGFFYGASTTKRKLQKEGVVTRMVEVHDPTLATTVRNNSYIRLDISGAPCENIATILKMVAGFEEKNPDKEVVGWAVDGHYGSYGIKPKVYGLWINHRPKPISLEK
jgi:hypothetical protein